MLYTVIALMMALLVLAMPAWAVTQNSHGTSDTMREMQRWFGDTMAPGVVGGCHPAVPSSSLTLAAISCQAYVRGSDNGLVYVDQDSHAIGPLNQGNGTYWLAIHRDTQSSTTPGGWQRQAGTAYLWKLSLTQPDTPTAAIMFSQVTVASGAITAVVDLLRPQTGWVENRLYGVRTDNPKTPNVFFVNSGTPLGVGAGPAPRVWHQYNVATFGVPPDATAVDLMGIMIITHGTTAGDCDIRVAMRAAGDTLDPLNYVWQVIEPHTDGGQRTPSFARVPVRNGVFEIYYDMQRNGLPINMGVYPTDCAMGVNIAMQGYTRAGQPPGTSLSPPPAPQTLTGVINVQSYGATGNGAVSDSAALQAAADAAPEGSTIWVPPGVYCQSAGWRIKHSRTRLMGTGSAILRVCTNWTTPTITGALAAQINLIDASITNGPTGATHITDITIEGLRFEGQASSDYNSPKCISGLFADNVTIRHNTFSGSPYECIDPEAGHAGTDWKVESNHFIATGQSAVANAKDGTAVQMNASGATVTGNTFNGVATAIGSSVIYGRAAITGNTILFPTLTGVELGGTVVSTGFASSSGGTDDLVVNDNVIALTAVAGVVRRGITVLEPTRDVNISGNAIRLYTASGGDELHGIALHGPFQGCHVGDNMILMDAAGGDLAASKKFLGIYGVGGPVSHLLRCHLASNTIRYINPTTSVNHTGIFAIAGSGETYTLTATANNISGFTNANSQYGIRLSKTVGTINYAAVGNVVNDGGLHEYGGTAYCNGTCGGLPVTAVSSGPSFLIDGVDLGAVLFANLGAPANGRLLWCSDCAKATPCTGSGVGAFAKRRNGTWDCD